MFAAYFDESGTHAGSRSVAVGGFMAHTDSWKKFRKPWRAALQREQVSHFHATDLETSHGEFKGWKAPRRIAFQQSLIGVIRDKLAGHHGIACGFDSRDYDTLVQEGTELRKIIGSAVTFCVYSCVFRVLERVRLEKLPVPISFIFEDGGTSNGGILSLLAHYRSARPEIGPVTFGDKRQVLELQPADLHAYEAWKHAENRIVEGPQRPIRKSLQAVLSPSLLPLKTQGWIMNREELAWFVAQAKKELGLRMLD